ncbi:hypothetical protein OROMI_009043 [Orobanche minor]
MLAADLIAGFGQCKHKTPTARWSKPDKGWLKLNIDGGSSAAANKSVAVVFVGMTRSIGTGLEFDWERRTFCLVVEIDSSMLFHLIQDIETANDAFLRLIVEDSKALLRRPWIQKLVLIDRGCNRCADKVAKLSYAPNSTEEYWVTPPAEILHWMIEETL